MSEEQQARLSAPDPATAPVAVDPGRLDEAERPRRHAHENRRNAGIGTGGVRDDARPSTSKLGARLGRAFDIILRGVAAALALSLVVAGWHDVSQGYDIWFYHLPFAARLTGIIDASSYAFSADNRARFEGFPLLAELLQGIVWRVTGHIEATSFVSLAALFGLPLLLRRAFRVPLHLALLALLAIPLVQIHASSSYVDLPGNACATMLLLCVYRVIVVNEPPSPRLLAGCAVLAAATVNTKFQLFPIVVASSIVLLFFAFREVGSWSSASESARSTLKKRALVFVIALPIVFATPIKNTIAHGNPVWPVELKILRHSFPHREAAYSQSPRHLASSPRPIRFVRSVLEIDNLPISSMRRWSLDQWAPPDDPSCRMGGYFGAYVLVNLAALGWAAWRKRTRETIAAAVLFGGVTIVASLVPQSHELRYYMHWMLLLVCLNLIVWVREARAAVGVVATTALALVVWATSAGFLYASGSTFAEFLARRTDTAVIDSAAPGERLCISREPFTFLYAPAFHTRKDYAVQEATRDSDCKDARPVP